MGFLIFFKNQYKTLKYYVQQKDIVVDNRNSINKQNKMKNLAFLVGISVTAMLFINPTDAFGPGLLKTERMRLHASESSSVLFQQPQQQQQQQQQQPVITLPCNFSCHSLSYLW